MMEFVGYGYDFALSAPLIKSGGRELGCAVALGALAKGLDESVLDIPENEIGEILKDIVNVPDTDYDRQLCAKIVKYGLMDFEDNDLRLGDKMTRAEFCRAIYAARTAYEGK